VGKVAYERRLDEVVLVGRNTGMTQNHNMRVVAAETNTQLLGCSRTWYTQCRPLHIQEQYSMIFGKEFFSTTSCTNYPAHRGDYNFLPQLEESPTLFAMESAQRYPNVSKHFFYISDKP